MSVLSATISALNVDAPAPAATYQSRAIQLRREEAFGAVSVAVLVDTFIWHEAQAYTYFLEGSNTGNVGDWWLLATATKGGGDVPGTPGTLVTVRCPFKNFRVRVTNGGAAPATNFRVVSAGQTL